jgi:uncharacterized protein
MTENTLETGVGGLICRQCEDLFRSRMLYVRGVIDAECSYFRGRAKIRYDADILSEEELKRAMEDVGFPASEKSGKGKLYDLLSVLAIVVLLILARTVSLPLIPKADNGTSYAGLYLIGLVTGTHCMVMCGGIMLSQTAAREFPTEHIRRGKELLPVISYNFGRVLMAGILGAVFGAIGKHILFSLKAKSMVFTLTGLYIVLIALGIWGVPAARRIQSGIPTLCDVKRKIPAARQAGPFIAGLLTALLPCASSNSMWLLAVSSGSAVKGLLTMFSWALGTVPFMVLFGMFASYLSGKKQAWMIRVNMVLMMTLGLNLMIMGLELVE